VNGTPLLSAHIPTAPMYVKSESSMAVACSFKRDGGGQGEVGTVR
jgi:hypothetical protein